MVSARRRTFTWSKPVVPTSAIGPRDDTTTIPPLKCDECTVELKDDVWARWLAWDPVRMARARPDTVAGLRAVYIDSGTKDEYYLDLGAEAFRRECEAAGVADVRFELFEGKHGGIDYRYPIALGWLAERLARVT